jgi:hypothetical protein
MKERNENTIKKKERQKTKRDVLMLKRRKG